MRQMPYRTASCPFDKVIDVKEPQSIAQVSYLHLRKSAHVVVHMVLLVPWAAAMAACFCTICLMVTGQLSVSCCRSLVSEPYAPPDNVKK